MRRVMHWSLGIIAGIGGYFFLVCLIILPVMNQGDEDVATFEQGVIGNILLLARDDGTTELSIPARIYDCPDHLKEGGSGPFGVIDEFWNMPTNEGWYRFVVNSVGEQHPFDENGALSPDDFKRYFPQLTELASSLSLPAMQVRAIGCVINANMGPFEWELHVIYPALVPVEKLHDLPQRIAVVFQKTRPIRYQLAKS